MEIKLTPPLTGKDAATAIKPMIESWQVGQLVKATVVSRPTANNVVLKVDNVLVTAQPVRDPQAPPTELLQPGVQLLLKVIRGGASPTLQIQTPPRPAEVRENVLREALPRQTPLPAVMANLMALASSAADTRTQAPQPVTQILRHLLQNLPSSQELRSRDGVEKALRDSGLFLENKLAVAAKGTDTGQSAEDTSRDLKANLLRLLESARNSQGSAERTTDAANRRAPSTEPSLRSALAAATAHVTRRITGNTPPSQHGAPAPPRTVLPSSSALPTAAGSTTQTLPPTLSPNPAMLKPSMVQAQPRATPTISPTQMNSIDLLADLVQQVEGALARLRVSQVAQTPGEQQNPAAWTVEVPVRHQERVDLFHIGIEQDEDGGGDDREKAWTVTLAFALDELGPIFARIKVIGRTVSAVLTAEQTSTVRRIEQNMNWLAQGLDEAGLKAGSLSCQQGPMPIQPKVRISHTLVDTRA